MRAILLIFLAFAAFMFSLSFLEDMIAEVHSINKCVKAKNSEESILKRLTELVAMHSDVIQLSGQFSLTVYK